MIKIKKYIFGALIALSIPALVAYAATPMLSVTGTDDNVTLTVRGGEINAPVVLYYNQNLSGQGTVQQRNIGTTDINGNFTGQISTSGVGVSQSSPVYVQVGGYQSLPVNWTSGTATSGSTNGTTNSTNTSVLSFSPSSPSFATGQTGTVTISGGNGGSYYIASNSNPNFTTASISGNTLTVSGSQAGQSSVTVCSTAGPCTVVTPTFGANTNTNGNTSTSGSFTGTTSGSPTLSQGSINVNQNGQGSITLSGGTTPYTISVPSGSGITTTLMGNTLYINGNNATGVNTIQVCSANNSNSTNSGGCTSLTINMGGSTTTNTNTNTTTSTTGNGNIGVTIPVTLGQPLMITLAGGVGSYFLQSPVSSPALASLSGNTLMLSGATTGTGTVTVCQTGASSCLPISFIVNPALTGTGGGYLFDTDFGIGTSGQDVTELQTRLTSEGYFTATPTGYFGPITQSAVMGYQSAHGIPATGFVGPLTRAMLNQ